MSINFNKQQQRPLLNSATVYQALDGRPSIVDINAPGARSKTAKKKEFEGFAHIFGINSSQPNFDKRTKK